jgi:hypothetical protein
MAMRLLTGPELESMEADFEAFDARTRADGSYEGLYGLADRLISAFRPNDSRMAAAAQLVGCGG